MQKWLHRFRPRSKSARPSPQLEALAEAQAQQLVIAEADIQTQRASIRSLSQRKLEAKQAREAKATAKARAKNERLEARALATKRREYLKELRKESLRLAAEDRQRRRDYLKGLRKRSLQLARHFTDFPPPPTVIEDFDLCSRPTTSHALVPTTGTWEEIQEWYRDLTMLDGAIMGPVNGRGHRRQLLAMYELQRRSDSSTSASNRGITRGAPTIGVIGGGLAGVVIAVASVVLGPAQETLSTGVSMEIMAAGLGTFFGGLGWAVGSLAQIVLMFKAVHIPFTVQIYDMPTIHALPEPTESSAAVVEEDEETGAPLEGVLLVHDKAVNGQAEEDDDDFGDLVADYHREYWWPPLRAIGMAPRMAWVAARSQYYYGPQGGGVFTATHVRLKSYDREIIIGPSSQVYGLEDDPSMADETNGVDVRSLLVKGGNVAELYPQALKNKRAWMNKENLLTGVFVVILLASLLMLASASGT